MPIRDVETGEKTPLLGRGAKLIARRVALLPDAPKEKVVLGIACAAFITSLLSILFQPNLAVLVSSMLGILVAPYTALQQQRITLTEQLRERNASVEDEVRALTDENETLRVKIVEAQEVGSSLASLQNALEAVRGLETTSAETLDEQVDLAREVLHRMKLNHRPPLVQSLLDVLIASDDDSNNMILSDSEINDLIRNLGSRHAVQLNEDLARKTILEHGRSTGAILAIVRSILIDSSDEEQIFHFESEK